MNRYLKVPFREPKLNVFLEELRERLLKTMLYSSFMAGTVLFGFALIPAIQNRLYLSILVYSVAYLWSILIAFIHRLPYRVRAISWLCIFYAFGCINLVDSGFNVDAGLFLIAFITMAILFLDLQGGLVALLLSAASVVILGFVHISGRYQLPLGLPQSSPMLWIIGGIIFLSLGALLIYSLTIVVHGLDRNLSKVARLVGELEKTNQTLRISEARYRTLVEASPGLVALLDLSGNTLMVNQVGLGLFGYQNPEEVVGKNVLAFFAPEDQSRVDSYFQRTVQGGPPNDFTCLGVKKDGAQFYGEYNATLVKDDAGMPQAVICIGRDITERMAAEKILQDAKDVLAQKVVETKDQLERTSNRLEELVKHGPTVIFSYQVPEGLTYLSENVSALLGYEASEFSAPEDFLKHVHPEDKERISAQFSEEVNRERSVNTYRFKHKDGDYRWLHDERVLQRDELGKPLEYIGSWSDITELKKKEEALRFFQDRYRSLYESMMDAYVSIDMTGRIQQFNLAYLQMLGYAAEELRKLTDEDLTPKKWHDLEAGIVKNQVLPNGYSDIYEKEYIRKDGTVLPVELRTVLMHDQVGNPSGMWAIVRDISERKIIEQNLRESEGRNRDLLESSMQGVIVLQDMRVAYINKAVTDLLGYTQADVEKLSLADIKDLLHPDDQPIFQQRLEQRLPDTPLEERFSLRILHKNGELHWLETQTRPIQLQGKPARLISFIDVTEIRQAQAKLEESAKVQKTILNASEALVVLIDMNGVIITSNERFARRMGLKVESIAGTSMFDILPEEVANARKVYFDQVFNSKKPVTFVDNRGETWFENSVYPILDMAGNVVSVAVYARDITEQRRVEEALRSSEEQYRTLAETAHDMIFIINQDDQIKYVNSFGAKILGQEPQKLVGQPREKFFPPVTSQHQKNNILRVLETGEAISSENANEFPSGSVWLHTWLVPLRDVSGEVTSVLGVSRDITDLKRAEEVLLRARDQLEERVEERTRALSASQEQLRLLTAQTVKAQEDERRLISRELHDEAGQALITLKYDLAAIQNELPNSDSQSRQRLSESMSVIDQTMQHIRGLAHSLRPPVLDIGGINLSLQEYCREVTGRTKIPIYYQGLDFPELPDEIGISLFRFVQEALTNILKYANASMVKIKLQYKKGEISLSVSDNGRGMEDAGQGKGLGLLGIKERLNLLDGRLEINSTKGRGTKLVAHVPWVRKRN